ncbi:MAG: glycosyltransferase family 4 protein [Nitrospirae bacterium]|nr:glycosyltransferase family 4 protein [Nitrospirota bacterium]
MQILIVNYEYPPIGGGGGLFTRDIAECMAGLGHGVTVLTSLFRGLKKKENVNGVDVVRVPVLFRNKKEAANLPSMLSYFPSSVYRAYLSMNRGAYDIINTHFAIPSGPTGYILARAFRIPNVLSIHGGDIFDPGKALSPHRTPGLSTVVRAMLNKAECVVAQSQDTKQRAICNYRIKREINVIPLGIGRTCFQKKSRLELGFEADETIFCTVGRLVERKNVGGLITILSGIKDKYRFRLLIIGDGPERGCLEKSIAGSGLKDSVFILGNVPDEKKFQIMAASDIYLSTSLHEGFGLVFLEAMECGLPVICYDCGGQNDFLADGRTGFLVRLGNEEEMKKRTVELMTNSELVKRMGAYNKEIVRNYYIDKCAADYLSLFEGIISAGEVKPVN